MDKHNCNFASVTVSKPVTVTVAGQGGQPYPGLKVYAFTGSTYTGYHGASDENGQLTLTLPLGEYRFRADYDGVQFWSGQENHCAIPGCEDANVTLPGGTSESVITIDYEYDALRRLTSAVYSNGISFHYAYDAAGNVLEYSSTVNGQSSVTSYQYDSANQLTTATQGSTVWNYTYDGNGSLVETTPEGNQNGAKRYTYNAAGYLTQVETYANGWQVQAEMLYDGLGNRLQMTVAGVTTQYELDNGQLLSADADGNVTYYLYGLGLIAEQTDAWAYSLPDGSNTPRQLVNAAGEVTFAASYTPWGDTLETYGSGRFTQGYFGGMMDIATGLIYVGNGQYYDPATGRFLTRDARPNQNNPYTPVDPTGALLGPLALLALVFGRKKARNKWDMLVLLLALSLSLGMGLAACVPGGPPESTPPFEQPGTPPPTETPGPGQGGGSGTPTPPPPTPSPVPCPTPSPTPTPGFENGLIIFGSNWSDEEQTIVWAAIKKVGERFSHFLDRSGTDAFLDAYQIRSWPLTFLKADDLGRGECKAASRGVVKCERSVNMDNPRWMVHEFGHLLQHSRYVDGSQGPYGSLQKAAIVNDRGDWVTGSHDPKKPETFERTMLGYVSDRMPDVYHGEGDYPLDWDDNNSYTARNEDFADMFLNWVYDSFGDDYGAGRKRYDWVNDNIGMWIQ